MNLHIKRALYVGEKRTIRGVVFVAVWLFFLDKEREREERGQQ